MDNRETLRVALLGAGRMGSHHARAIALQERASLVAVADPAAAGGKLGEPFPDSVAVYSDAGEMLRAVQADVVHIVTPPSTHVELARLAVKHGAHVYVEKPVGLSRKEVDQLLRDAERRGCMVCGGHQLLAQGPMQRLRAILPLIGNVVHVESYFAFRPVRRSPDGRGMLSPTEQLVDILPHPVYTMLELLDDGAGSVPRIVAQEVGPGGEVRAILRNGSARAVLIVTLVGRPVESYLRVVGTNGSAEADFVLGSVVSSVGPGSSAIVLVLKPFREARQLALGSMRGILRKLLGRQKSYAGLSEMVGSFYEAVRSGGASPTSPASIRGTVTVCERLGIALGKATDAAEAEARKELEAREADLAAPDPDKGCVLVTGGTGFLGRATVARLRQGGWPVRVVARRDPPWSARIPGIEYVVADIGAELPPDMLDGVETVVHLAAETAGGQEAHERNTVTATRRIAEAAAAAGVRRFLNISSVAVLKPSHVVGGALSESSPVDRDNLARGPYVWAKAEAEGIVTRTAREAGMIAQHLRLGPLVDFRHFEPPGRLGRELGPWYVAVGSGASPLPVCDVETAAFTITEYVANMDSAPDFLNLLEPDVPRRRDLVERLRRRRPDLKIVWLPFWLLRPMSLALSLLQRLLRPGRKPLDVYAAFSAERYDLSGAAEFLQARGWGPDSAGASPGERSAAHS